MMQTIIYEVKNKVDRDAKIQLVDNKLIPYQRDGWNFNWKKLCKVEGSIFYKISCLNSPDILEGILMLTLFNKEMLFMNNIELAPHNIGSKKKFDKVAGVLLAFACRKSFEIGKGNYNGFLSFDSKSELIKLYSDRYGATWAMGNKMFFTPEAGKKLMKKFLQQKK